MDKLYLITRLDDVRGIFITILVLSAIALIGFIAVFINYRGITLGKEDNKAYTEENYYRNLGKKGTIWSAIFLFISMSAICLLPTTKQALLLFGVKETVKYCDKHPEIKQLPSQCVKALTLYIDKETQETETKQ